MRRLFVRRSFLVLCAPVLALALGLTGCGDRTTAVERGNREGVLHYAISAEPRDLDPQLMVSYNDMKIVIALFEGLTVVDETSSQPIPAAAASWEISPDRLTWTFHLRDNLRWSDDRPLTANDFLFSFKRALSPSMATEYAYVLYPIVGAEAYAAGTLKNFDEVGVKAPDERTVVFTLRQPNAAFAAILALPISYPVPRQVIEADGQRADDRMNPWTRPGSLVVTERNPYYRDNAHNVLNGLVFYPFDNAAAQESAFRAGQLHITSDVPLSKLATYRADHPAQLRTDPFIETGFVRFNRNRGPLADRRVRQALSMTIDRAAIAEHVLIGGQQPATRFTPPNTAGYTASYHIDHDVEKAQALLAEAGFPGGQGFPALELTTFPTETNQRVVETVQQMWARDLGIRVNLLVKEQRVLLNDERELNYDISLGRWVGDYVDPSTFLELFTTTSGNNNTGWSDSAYDELVTRAPAAATDAERFSLYDEAETRLLDAAPIAPIYHGTQAFLIAPSVQGWKNALLGFHRYQFVHLVAQP